ncbi:MAG: hypothetical protein ACFBSG_05305 [Leptolyngbyaceae cyanobacterium]
MLTSTPALNPRLIQPKSSLQPTKLLGQREDYTTCHILLPEEGERLPAIALDGHFYSFFRSLDDPQKILRILLKLSAKGERTVMTPNKRGYAIWVHEPTAVLATSKGKASRQLPSSFGPANCWIISDRQPGYRLCTLNVPDLPDAVPGLAQGQKLFSLYRREQDADNTLKLGSRLSQRGDEIVIVISNNNYGLCIYEPGATALN